MSALAQIYAELREGDKEMLAGLARQLRIKLCSKMRDEQFSEVASAIGKLCQRNWDLEQAQKSTNRALMNALRRENNLLKRRSTR